MMLRLALITLTSIFSIAAFAQETKEEFDGHKWEAPYALPIPKDWTIERFLIPISFAPEITYKGVEDIRFTPGWAKQSDDEYWSYAFLWYLDGDVSVDAKKIEDNLRAYYSGLVKLNGATIPAEKLVPVATSFKKLKTELKDRATFSGTVTMNDYMTQKPFTLYCKVHLLQTPAGGKTYIFHELSPQLFTHKVWKGMDQLWADFKDTKP